MTDGPTDRHLRALRAVKALEEGRDAIVNSADAEACADKGWLDATDSPHPYVLTTAGRRALANTP